jgi:diacylglycerol kinase (ATP)
MESPNKFDPGPLHVFHALKAALNGFREAWKYEDAFRQELFVAAIAIPFALLYPTDKISKILMVSSILLVLVLELVNSAIEAAVDHTSLDQHPFAKRAKDIAGAAVLTSMVNVLVVWGIILFA